MLPLLIVSAILGWLAFIQVGADSKSGLDSVHMVPAPAAPLPAVRLPHTSSSHLVIVVAGSASANRLQILLAEEAELSGLLGEPPRSADLIEVSDERSARELAASIQRDANLFASPANVVALP